MDQASNRCNIMAALVFEKTTEQNLRDVFQNKMPTNWRRFRSRMFKVLDQYYFKELPAQELQKQLAGAVPSLNNIHSMEDVSAFMAE